MSRPDPSRGDSRVGLTGIRRGPVEASVVWREFDGTQTSADPGGTAFRGIHEEPEPPKDWHKEIEALKAQFAAEREEAYQKGLRDGQAAGEAAGRAMAEAAHEARLRQVEARLATRAEAVERALGGLFLDYEARILELAMAVARRIVGDSVQAPGTAALHAARLAVRKLGSETRVVVRVHPSDAPELEREQEIWSRSGRRVEFVADPSVGRGGVLVETDAGSIDARIPRMTERVELALAQAFAEETERRAS